MERQPIDVYVDRYACPLSRLALSLCRNIADAEDLYQETWMKAIQFFDRYDPAKPFDRWLYTLCVNTYKNNCKSFFNRMQVAFRTSEDKDAFLSCIEAADEDQREERMDLMHALNQLPVKYQTVLVLKYFMDWTDAEIAQTLRIPEGTVKSRLHKAKELLARRITHETFYR